MIKRIITLAAITASSATLHAELLDVEKDALKFGFIKLTISLEGSGIEY